ncbi:hypothetical protein GGTG_02080 [Gaeumannomyces tritici R3-111a-1]|uniref:Fungal N-terminal domain-containing protein n=1 Tax=Gaeumannomyces tritici (strain R3-111a-1) TaxID=644352 RepID=J3NLD2_GAET3|nr:hypothetical protein GGTG_02080 [Gaeumannomyces tritici R3-111a-1]EJT82106.1 hypothetical protein GGTG_02080 [Gaeumannomyces tritici R3-111a-1]
MVVVEGASVLAVAKGAVTVVKTTYVVYTQLKAFQNAPSNFKGLVGLVEHMERSLERADAARREARERHNAHVHNDLMGAQATVLSLYKDLANKLDLTQKTQDLASDRKRTVCWTRIKVYIDGNEYKDLKADIFEWCAILDRNSDSLEKSSGSAPLDGAAEPRHG